VSEGSPARAVTQQAVVDGVARLRQSRLRVHHFQRRGLARLVAQQREPDTLRRQIRRSAQRNQLCTGRARLQMERPQIGQKHPLGQGQLRLCLLEPQFRLANPAAGGPPVKMGTVSSAMAEEPRFLKCSGCGSHTDSR